MTTKTGASGDKPSETGAASGRRKPDWLFPLQAFVVALAALAGLVAAVQLAGSRRVAATLTYELRLSGDAVGPAWLGGDVGEGQLLVALEVAGHAVRGAGAPRWSRDEGNRMIVSGRFALAKAGKPAAILVSRARLANYRFSLDLPANPAPSHGFDGWRRASLAFGPDGQPLTEGLDQYELRLRIDRKQE